jgi:hypothetical protein
MSFKEGTGLPGAFTSLRRRAPRFARLISVVGLISACSGVEDSAEKPACSLDALPTVDDEYAPGAKLSLVVQAVDADGDAVNGTKVYFLNVAPSQVSFANGAGELVFKDTKTQKADGVNASGIAEQSLTVNADAVTGEAKLVMGLIAPCSSTPNDAVRTVTLRIRAEAAEDTE